MPVERHPARLELGIALFVIYASAALAQNGRVAMPLQTRRIDPKEFGIQDDTITVVPATRFRVQSGAFGWAYSPSFGLFTDTNTDVHYYADLEIPAGAVIDMIGLNTTTDTDGVIGVELWARNHVGGLFSVAAFSATAHGWDTDYSGSIGYQVTTNQDREYVIDVENAPNPNYQYFGWVEVWWHRSVSPAPANPSFNDVPASHPFFQFIEALKASGITGGCGGGNYCPDNPVTRGQMAVFLAKALGLHWPY
jgi:hypothetical protein